MMPQLHFCSVLSVLLFCFSQQSYSLIVPQELPSVLSLVYSNIPPIKKGTDSRLGFGFRLGQHADFQVMVELGPQKETRPIGDQDPDNMFNKRQVNSADQQSILRQLKATEGSETTTKRYAANWLESWSQEINAPKKSTKTKKKYALNSPEPTMSVLPPESLKQLQLLYKLATTTPTAISTIEKQDDSFNRAAPIDLTERLNLEQQRKLLSLINQRDAAPLEKSKAKLTKELMDVRLDDNE